MGYRELRVHKLLTCVDCPRAASAGERPDTTSESQVGFAAEAFAVRMKGEHRRRRVAARGCAHVPRTGVGGHGGPE